MADRNDELDAELDRLLAEDGVAPKRPALGAGGQDFAARRPEETEAAFADVAASARRLIAREHPEWSPLQVEDAVVQRVDRLRQVPPEQSGNLADYVVDAWANPAPTTMQLAGRTLLPVPQVVGGPAETADERYRRTNAEVEAGLLAAVPRVWSGVDAPLTETEAKEAGLVRPWATAPTTGEVIATAATGGLYPLIDSAANAVGLDLPGTSYLDRWQRWGEDKDVQAVVAPSGFAALATRAASKLPVLDLAADGAEAAGLLTPEQAREWRQNIDDAQPLEAFDAAVPAIKAAKGSDDIAAQIDADAAFYGLTPGDLPSDLRTIKADPGALRSAVDAADPSLPGLDALRAALDSNEPSRVQTALRSTPLLTLASVTPDAVPSMDAVLAAAERRRQAGVATGADTSARLERIVGSAMLAPTTDERGDLVYLPRTTTTLMRLAGVVPEALWEANIRPAGPVQDAAAGFARFAGFGNAARKLEEFRVPSKAGLDFMLSSGAYDDWLSAAGLTWTQKRAEDSTYLGRLLTNAMLPEAQGFGAADAARRAGADPDGAARRWGNAIDLGVDLLFPAEEIVFAPVTKGVAAAARGAAAARVASKGNKAAVAAAAAFPTVATWAARQAGRDVVGTDGLAAVNDALRIAVEEARGKGQNPIDLLPPKVRDELPDVLRAAGLDPDAVFAAVGADADRIAPMVMDTVGVMLARRGTPADEALRKSAPYQRAKAELGGYVAEGKLTQAEADATTAQMEVLAHNWGRDTGRPAEEWFETRFRSGTRDEVEGLPEGSLFQREVVGPTSQEVFDELRRTQFIPTSRLIEVLGDKRPEYLDDVAKFILEQRQKVREGRLTPRDVAKAYAMTVASMRAGAINADLIEAPLGAALPDHFLAIGKKGQRQVRPEEAMAAWLFSPDGQRALDGIDRGEFVADAWESGAKVRDPFGANTVRTLNILEEPGKGQFTMRNIGDLVAEINAAKGDPKKVDAALRKLRGIKDAKSAFIGHLLGFGESPTMDSVEINGWLTGKADVGTLRTRAANLARKMKAKATDAPWLASAFADRAMERFKALRAAGTPGADLPDEVFGAVMHHWFWDRLKGTETTHAGLYEAMRLAAKGKGDITADAPRLVVQHNLTPENLLHADELGGLVAPSLGISRADAPYTGFGSITLVGPASLAEPKAAGVRWFDADVYSRRWPAQRHVVDRKAAEKWSRAELDPYRERTGTKHLGSVADAAEKGRRDQGWGAPWDEIKNLAATRLKYVEEVLGQPYEVPTRYDLDAADLSEDPRVRAVWADFTPEQIAEMAREGVPPEVLARLQDAVVSIADENAEKVRAARAERNPKRADEMADFIRRDTLRRAEIQLNDDGTINTERRWDAYRLIGDAKRLTRPPEPDMHAAGSALRDIIEKSPGGSEAYENWLDEQLAPFRKQAVFVPEGKSRPVPYTADNILAELVRNVRSGESFNYGLGNARAKGAKEYKTRAGIQADRSRVVGEEAMNAAKDALDAEFTDLVNRLGEYFSGDRFYLLDEVATVIGEGYKKGIAAEMRRNFKGAPPELVRDVAAFAEKLRAAPTEYFEGKATRVVPLSEFVGAVVPEGTPQPVLDALKRRGVTNIETYPSGDYAARRAAVAKMATERDVLFSKTATDTFGSIRPLDTDRPLAPTFYSALRRAIEGLKQDKVGVDQLRAQLGIGPGRSPSLPGVKADEVEWTRLGDFLDGKRSVTKAEVLDWLDENAVRVEERVLGVSADDSDRISAAKARIDELEREADDLQAQIDSLSNFDKTRPDAAALERFKEGWENLTAEVGEARKKMDALPPFTMDWYSAKEAVDDIEARMDAVHREMVLDTIERQTPRANELIMQRDGLRREIADLWPQTDVSNPTRYSSYTLPGGTNYREVLFRMPRGATSTKEARDLIALESKLYADHGASELDSTVEALPLTPTERARHQAALTAYQNAAARAADDPSYNAPHFDTEGQNLLAHVRVNDRTLPDGRKVLHIEEVQSDWAQAGRDKGFQEPRIAPGYKLRRATAEDTADHAVNVGDWVLVEDGPQDFEVLGSAPGHLSEREAVRQVATDATGAGVSDFGAIPRAPFVESTDRWVNLVLRRVLRMAAEEGYDGVTWTTGRTQVARYEDATRKAVDEIRWKKATPEDTGSVWLKDGYELERRNIDDGTHFWRFVDKRGRFLGRGATPREAILAARAPDTGDAFAAPAYEAWLAEVAAAPSEVQVVALKNGRPVYTETLAPEQVRATLGKEMAAAIDSSADTSGTFSGDTLTIGGQGMEEFYDRILPARMRELTKKGGGRVEEARVETGTLNDRMEGRPSGVKAVMYRMRTRQALVDYMTELDRLPPEAQEVAIRNGFGPLVTRADLDSALLGFGGERVHYLALTPQIRDQVLYEGQPLFSRRTDPVSGAISPGLRNASRYLITLFEKGDFQTLAHEGGHLATLLFGDKWEPTLARSFDHDADGRLTVKGHEQAAEAFRRWLNLRTAPNGRIRRLFTQATNTLANVWMRLRKQTPTLPPEVAAFWDATLRPDLAVRPAAQAIAEGVFPRPIREIDVANTPAERIDAEAVLRAGRKEEAGRVDQSMQNVRAALGIDKNAKSIDPWTALANAVAYVGTEQARRSFGFGELVRITPRSVVPASRVEEIVNRTRAHLVQAVGDPAALKVENGAVVLTPDQAAGLRVLVDELDAGYLGDALPETLTDPAADLTRIPEADWNRLNDTLKDTHAGVGARRDRRAEAVPSSLGYALVRGLAANLDRIDPLQRARAALVEGFVVPEIGEGYLRPDVREVWETTAREMGEAPTWVLQHARDIRWKDPAASTASLIAGVRAQLVPPIEVGAVPALVELRGLFGEDGTVPASMDDVLDRLPEITETLAAPRSDAQRAVGAMDGGGGGLSPQERQALVILARVKRGAINLATATDDVIDGVNDALSVIGDGIRRRLQVVDDRAMQLAQVLAGSKDANLLITLAKLPAERRAIYTDFYEGRWAELFDVNARHGLRAKTAGGQSDSFSQQGAALSMIVRMRALDVLGRAADRLTELGLTPTVDTLGARVGKPVANAALAGRVKHYIENMLTWSNTRQLDAGGVHYEPPHPEGAADLQAYTVANQVLSEYGFKLGKGADWTTMVLPDASEILIPAMLQKEVQASIDRVAQVGGAWSGDSTRIGGVTSTLDRLAGSTEEMVPLPGADAQKAAERAAMARRAVVGAGVGAAVAGPPGAVAGAVLAADPAMAVTAAIDAAAFTVRVAKVGLTTGLLLPNFAYYLGNAFGGLWQAYSGMGPVGTARMLMTEPRFTFSVVSRLWRDAPSFAVPDARAFVAKDGRVWTTDAVVAEARRAGLNSSLVRAETAQALARDIRDTSRSLWRRMMAAPIAWQNTLMEAATAIDNTYRVSAFVDGLKRGQSAAEAAATARAIAFDYGALTDFERSTMRRAVLFYSFTRRNIDLFWDTLLTNPSRVLGQLRLMNGAQRITFEDDPENRNLIVPEYLDARLLTGFRRATMNSYAKDRVVHLSPPIPVGDALNLHADLLDIFATATGQRADATEAGRGIASRIAPWWQAPFVYAGGTEFFTGRSLDNLAEVPPWMVETDRMLTGGLVVDDLFKVRPQAERDPSAEEAPGLARWVAGNGEAWWAFRNLVQIPPFGRAADTITAIDRSQLGVVEALVNGAQAWNPAGAYAPNPRPDVGMPRPGLTPNEERAGLMGFRSTPLDSPEVAEGRLYRDAEQRAKDAAKKAGRAEQPGYIPPAE